jgi:hypothetical protein
MGLQATRVDVWAATLKDVPGSLAQKLSVLSEAGANLQFVVARREHAKPGTGVVFVTPIRGAAQAKAAKSAGFAKTKSLQSLRVEGPDKPGQGARITTAIAQAGISLRGLSAASIGRSFVTYLAFDAAKDASKARSILRKLR